MTAAKETARRRDARPGRPRDPAADRAILRATLKLLTDQGYAGMSVERVASEAGVGKTTIYRRYASKEELAVAAIGTLRDEMGSPPDTGSACTDIVEMIVQSQMMAERGPGFAMIGALLVEERRNPELLELFRERIMQPRTDDALKVLQRGVDRGEIRPDVDLEFAVHAMLGALFVRHVLGTPESRKRIAETVDTIWGGLAKRSKRE